MRDGDGYVWIGVHFGSRGLGHTSATRYLKAAGGQDGMNVPPAVVDEDSELGRRYIAAMELAGRYSYAGREWVIERVRQIIGGAVTDMVHNHHNYAWRETHRLPDGSEREVIVHRKGATPAGAGVLGIIPGSMGAPGYVVRGKGSAAALGSASHGAGRRMSRTKAKELFTWEMAQAVLKARGVTLISAGLDEVPMAYKDIDEVMAAQRDLVEPLARFEPRLVKMAPGGERPED